MDDNRAIFSKPSSGFGKAGESERKYLVSELLPFVPPAIAAKSGIPMELEVSIPMPADESGEVKLSTIYQACPKLFAAEITPLNDSEITLPVKLSGFSSEEEFASSPFVPGKAFGGDPDGASKPQAHHKPESANPFWSPVSEPETADQGGKTEDSSEKSASQKEEPASQFGGFDKPVSRDEEKQGPPAEPDPVETGFSGMPFGGNEDFVTLFSNDERSKDGPDVEEEEDSEPSTSWGSMFQAPKRDPETEEDVQDTVKSSDLGGFEDFSLKPDETDADPVEKVVKEPLAPLGFEQPSSGFEMPKKSAPVAPEQEKDTAAESNSRPEREPDEVKQEPEAAVKPESKSEPEPKLEWKSVAEPKPEPTVKPESNPESEAELKAEPEPEAAVKPEFSPEPEPKLEREVEPEVEPEPKQESKPAPADVQHFEKTKPEIEWTSTPAPLPAAVAAEPAVATETRESPVSSLVQGSRNDDMSDVELRAIFSTSERFTLAKLARKVVGLPGIAACALSGSGKVVQASKSEENQLGAGAHDMVAAVRNIAKMTGMDEARSFTMKTEFGVVSLFLEGDCCLSVNHAEGEFGPGIREKLIVIARSLHKLAD